MKKKTVVTFGDSTTAPREAIKVYTTLLAENYPHCEFINSGVSGNTTRMAKERFEHDVLKHRPDVVIIQFGINDSAVDLWKNPPAAGPRVPLSEYEDNLRYFIRELKKSGCRIILMTPNPLCWTEKLRELYGRAPYHPEEEEGFNVILERYVAAVKTIAASENVEILDVHNACQNYCGTRGISLIDILPDGMHPGNEAHRFVADLLMTPLKRILQESED